MNSQVGGRMQTDEAVSKRSILKKLFQVGSNTLASRFLGLTREILLMRFLGVTAVADAFTTAFLIPNSFRKIFAEGALSAAFVPTFVTTEQKEGRDAANALMSVAFLCFEGVVLLLCAILMWKAEATIRFFAPGFSDTQMAAAIPCLRILMPFIFFLSSSALLTAGLQSVHHFFVPAFSPILLNAFFIGGIMVCLSQGFSVEYLCAFVLCGGLGQFILHLVAYFSLNFSFKMPSVQAWKAFAKVVAKFLFCFLSMSVMEFNLMIDQRFASYLPVGSVTLLKYSNRFMGIPLGVFAVAFSTILLPHFTKTSLYNRDRLGFYLQEGAKFVFWVTVPAALMMSFLASDIFLTLFASSSKKFPMALVPDAGWMLVGFLFGLFFFSINKLVLSLFYSLHDTKYPMITAGVATLLNVVFNYIFVGLWQGFGLAFATSLSGGVQMMISLYFLRTVHGFKIEADDFMKFVGRYALQMAAVLAPCYFLYGITRGMVERIFATGWMHFFMIKSFGYWLWAGPLMVFCFYILYKTRELFGIKIYFLD